MVICHLTENSSVAADTEDSSIIAKYSKYQHYAQQKSLLMNYVRKSYGVLEMIMYWN